MSEETLSETGGFAHHGPADDGHGGRLTVTVHDEDAGGDPLVFAAGPGEKVGKVIVDLYKTLGVAEQPTDRLLCLTTGESVFPHREEHLRDYAAGVCRDLVWTFARDTGGA